MNDIIVIGAGASGMAAAVCAAKAKRKVLIIEHNSNAGRKILATGNGRCNLTNLNMDIRYYNSHNIEKVGKWIDKFSPQKIMDFFSDIGVSTVEKNGYVYPASLQAATVNDGLISQCLELGVEFSFDTHVLEIKKEEDGRFSLLASMAADDGRKKRVTFLCSKVIIATGGKAYRNLGSDGSGYSLAKSLGLKINPVVPALTGLKCRGKYIKAGTGARVNGNIKLYCDNEFVTDSYGEIQLTDYGISGIPVFQISRHAAYGLSDGCRVQCKIDFLPQKTYDDVKSFLRNNIKAHVNRHFLQIINGIINGRLARMILECCQIHEDIIAANVTESMIKEVADKIKGFVMQVVGTNDFEQSQVCAGGIDLRETDDSFQCKKIEGCYITGELLDVDGICGGYNLHFAWLSGIVAGTDAAEGNI